MLFEQLSGTSQCGWFKGFVDLPGRSILLTGRSGQTFTLLALMDDISTKAEAQGLTPEILEDFLNEA